MVSNDLHRICEINCKRSMKFLLCGKKESINHALGKTAWIKPQNQVQTKYLPGT